jgi:hypothetical protein
MIVLHHFKQKCLTYCPEKNDDSVAQLVEHYTFNVVVLGSNPRGNTHDSIKRN